MTPQRRRWGCEHRSSGGACYECATQRKRHLTPETVEPVSDDSRRDSDVRVYHEPPPLPEPQKPALRAPGFRDLVLSGHVPD